MSDTLNIHLYNFEEPSYEDSKYVLTSPRSLEACAKVGVKPVDLLYKPLAEFQEELLPQDIPLRTIYNIYDEHEQERQRKLHLCREERNKLGKLTKTRHSQRSHSKNLPHRNTLHRSYSDENINQSKSSLQRMRTAWATSVRHTKDDINQRSKTGTRPRSTSNRSNSCARSLQRSSDNTLSTSRQRSPGNALSASTPCLLSKNTLRDARPITNQSLRRKLNKSMDVKNICITPRDEKILELMMSKGEQEKCMEKERLMTELEWDLQKKYEEDAKTESEMRRRHAIAEENRIKERKKLEKEKIWNQMQENLIEQKQKEIEKNMKSWTKKYDTVLTMRDLTLSDRKMKENAKKSSQERALQLQSCDEFEMRDMIADRHKDLLNSAAQKKEDRMAQENMKMMMQNRNRRKTFEKRWQMIEKQHNKAVKLLQSSLNQKLKSAEQNYESKLLRRDHEIQLSRLERERKTALAQLSKQKMENEMDKWRESVIDHRKSVDKKAADVAATTVKRKAIKAHEDRENKEKTQQRNIRKIHQEMEAWRQETETNLTKKDMKVSAVQQDKDQTIDQLRLIASHSQQLRDELREKYGAESFDKKAFKAELFNKIVLS